MTIVMIGQKGLPARSGGIEHHVESLAKGLVQRGHRVVVFGRAWYVGKEQAPVGVEQICTWGIRSKHLDAITHSLSALIAARRVRPDIIHIHGVGIALLAPLVRLFYPKAKLVVTFHCMDRRFSKWGAIARAAFWVGEWLTCTLAHEVVTVSQELHRYCVDTYNRRAHYVSHAFTFVPPVSPEAAEARVRALGLEPYQYLLFVGRLLPHKGAHRFLEAFARLKQERSELTQHIKAAVVGGSSFTDAYERQIQALFASTPDTLVLGERFDADLRALQVCALGHVFPSTDEGLSLAVLEAASTGRPVVMNDMDANREATGGFAHMVDAASSTSLMGGIEQLLSAPEETRRLQGGKLAAYVAETFNAAKSLDSMDHLYRDVALEEEKLVTQQAS